MSVTHFLTAQAQVNKPVLAVMEFDVAAGRASQQLGTGLSDMLTNALVETGKYRLVERKRLEEIMREQKLNQSGAVNRSGGASIGQLTGAGYLIMSTVTEFKENESGGAVGALLGSAVGGVGMYQSHIGFTVRIVDSSTGEILISKSIDKKVNKVGLAGGGILGIPSGAVGYKSKSMQDAMEKAIKETVEFLGAQLDGLPVSQLNNQDASNTAVGSPPKVQSANLHQQGSGGLSSLENIGSSGYVAGERELFTDYFEQDAVGDFPAKWNTNNSGAVVTLNGIPGKWLKIPQRTASWPELDYPLPENFTIDFDLVYSTLERRNPIHFGFGVKSEKFYFTIYDIIEHKNGQGGKTKSYGLEAMVGTPVHFSIAVNNTRIRLFIEDKKIFDLPKAFNSDSFRKGFYVSSSFVIPEKEDAYYLGNLRIAEAGIDARSSIIKEMMERGSASTSAILFEVNSDKLQESSFKILDEIAAAMVKDRLLRIKIIGHTDGTGKAEHNLQLSEKRARAVKNYLVQRHGIDASRLETQGRGALAQVASNSSEEGRAKNRRVEFVKL